MLEKKSFKDAIEKVDKNAINKMAFFLTRNIGLRVGIKELKKKKKKKRQVRIKKKKEKLRNPTAKRRRHVKF